MVIRCIYVYISFSVPPCFVLGGLLFEGYLNTGITSMCHVHVRSKSKGPCVWYQTNILFVNANWCQYIIYSVPGFWPSACPMTLSILVWCTFLSVGIWKTTMQYMHYMWIYLQMPACWYEPCVDLKNYGAFLMREGINDSETVHI